MKNSKLYYFILQTMPCYMMNIKGGPYALLLAMLEYPELSYNAQCKLAAQYRSCTAQTIKNNVRKLNNTIWERQRFRLFEMAGSCLKVQPSDKDFLRILLDEFIRTNGEVEKRYISETLYNLER